MQQPLPLAPKVLSLLPFISYTQPSSCDGSAGTGAPVFPTPGALPFRVLTSTCSQILPLARLTLLQSPVIQINPLSRHKILSGLPTASGPCNRPPCLSGLFSYHIRATSCSLVLSLSSSPPTPLPPASHTKLPRAVPPLGPALPQLSITHLLLSFHGRAHLLD